MAAQVLIKTSNPIQSNIRLMKKLTERISTIKKMNVKK